MKKIIFILLIPIISNGQELEGVWALKWGISLDSAITIIKDTKGYIPQIKKTDTTATLIFVNAKWGFETSTFTRLEFYKNKLYSAIAFFIPETGDELFKVYNSIKSSISEKYFPPQTDTAYYNPPFSKDDPDNKKAAAILSGNGFTGCSWNFFLASHFKNYGLIALSIVKDKGIVLWYRDGYISDIVDKQIKQQSTSDY